jgi:hypothetical protein
VQYLRQDWGWTYRLDEAGCGDSRAQAGVLAALAAAVVAPSITRATKPTAVIWVIDMMLALSADWSYPVRWCHFVRTGHYFLEHLYTSHADAAMGQIRTSDDDVCRPPPGLSGSLISDLRRRARRANERCAAGPARAA